MADRVRSLLACPRAPLVLLAALSVLSLGARFAFLGSPCRSPCRSASDHVLIFDEAYYVNAARVIAGLRPPPGAHYADSPAGVDPNAEHPQLAKLIIAGSIELFGDGPLAWRLGSILLGTLAILGLFVLVRAARGGRWLALGAAALMASDNLVLVHSRIGTLDIYALTAMIWAAALYLQGRPVPAGAVIGVGACAKEVTPYVLLVLALFEGLRLLSSRENVRARPARLGVCAVSAGAVFLGLLALLDRVAPPYDPVAGKRVGGGPLGHVGHILSYGAHQTSPHGPSGIASYPWQWLVDYKPITYLNINPARPADGLLGVHPAAHFLGVISPPVMLLALPALIVAARSAARRGRPRPTDLDVLAVAWFLGTWVPFELLSLFDSRTSYLYYMVIVMPAIYVAVARLLSPRRGPAALTVAWVAAVVVATVLLYPFTPLP
jgi:dolichyl-phosphate-mannose-protein mannosyltransferase